MSVLPQLLQYVGHTSPECLLHPSQALNTPFLPPDDLPATMEDALMESILGQRDEEIDYFMLHRGDSR